MKLLLTSNGFSNQSIVDALQSLLPTPITQSRIVFVPTAADIEDGDKTWLIDDLQNIKKAGFDHMDIVDIAALPTDQILPRMEKADVLMFGGGNTFFLLYCLEKSGLKEKLPELLKDKVYVGISAGSIVSAKEIITSASKKDYGPTLGIYEGTTGNGFVDFHMRPHLGSDHFPEWTEERLENIAKENNTLVYFIDDESAIKVDGDKVNIVSEGKYKVFDYTIKS